MSEENEKVMVEKPEIGDKVRWRTASGKRWRNGTVEHIFDFSNIWPNTYKNRIYIRIRPTNSDHRLVIKALADIEEMNERKVAKHHAER